MSSSEQRYVSLQDAADILGVHYMTAYRYMRHGRLLAQKESGIWKVAEVELQRFQAEQNESKESSSQTVKKKSKSKSGTVA